MRSRCKTLFFTSHVVYALFTWSAFLTDLNRRSEGLVIFSCSEVSLYKKNFSFFSFGAHVLLCFSNENINKNLPVPFLKLS